MFCLFLFICWKKLWGDRCQKHFIIWHNYRAHSILPEHIAFHLLFFKSLRQLAVFDRGAQSFLHNRFTAKENIKNVFHYNWKVLISFTFVIMFQQTFSTILYFAIQGLWQYFLTTLQRRCSYLKMSIIHIFFSSLLKGPHDWWWGPYAIFCRDKSLSQYILKQVLRSHLLSTLISYRLRICLRWCGEDTRHKRWHL